MPLPFPYKEKRAAVLTTTTPELFRPPEISSLAGFRWIPRVAAHPMRGLNVAGVLTARGSLHRGRAVRVERLGQGLRDPRRALVLDLPPLEHVDQPPVAQNRDRRRRRRVRQEVAPRA